VYVVNFMNSSPFDEFIKRECPKMSGYLRYRYDLHCDEALHTKAGRYVSGATVSVKAAKTSRLVSWLERDGGLKS
jgi:hypothetical protein